MLRWRVRWFVSDRGPAIEFSEGLVVAFLGEELVVAVDRGTQRLARRRARRARACSRGCLAHPERREDLRGFGVGPLRLAVLPAQCMDLADPVQLQRLGTPLAHLPCEDERVRSPAQRTVVVLLIKQNIGQVAEAQRLQSPVA